MRGPRRLPSGNRFGPYFCSRVEASPASSPLRLSVTSCFTTSSAGMACQAMASPAVLTFAAVSMVVFSAWMLETLERAQVQAHWLRALHPTDGAAAKHQPGIPWLDAASQGGTLEGRPPGPLRPEIPQDYRRSTLAGDVVWL